MARICAPTQLACFIFMSVTAVTKADLCRTEGVERQCPTSNWVSQSNLLQKNTMEAAQVNLVEESSGAQLQSFIRQEVKDISNRTETHTSFSFPTWYYSKAQGLTPHSCPKPERHLYATDLQRLLRGMDTFFRKQNITYSLWGGSFLAVVRAHTSKRPAFSMPWDNDVDFIITKEGFEKLQAMVTSIRTFPYATEEERQSSVGRSAQFMLDIDGGLTLLNDNLIRIATTSFAHGDFKSQWYPKLLDWVSHGADLNLDVVMQPGRYGDILNYRHINGSDKVEPCYLEDVKVSCVSFAFTYDDSPPAKKVEAEEWFARMTPYGSDSTGFKWQQEDHVWVDATCEFRCIAGKQCDTLSDNMHIRQMYEQKGVNATMST